MNVNKTLLLLRETLHGPFSEHNGVMYIGIVSVINSSKPNMSSQTSFSFNCYRKMVLLDSERGKNLPTIIQSILLDGGSLHPSAWLRPLVGPNALFPASCLDTQTSTLQLFLY